MPATLLEQYDGSAGIYVTWDWSGTAGVGGAILYRSDSGLTGSLTEIDTLTYPTNTFVDTYGSLESYYRVVEVDDPDAAVPTVLYTHPVTWGQETYLKAMIFYEILPFLRLWCYREHVYFNPDRTRGHVVVGKGWGVWNNDFEPIIEIGNPKSGDDQQPALQQLSRISTITDTTNAGGDYPDGLKYNIDYNGYIYFLDGNDDAEPIQVYDNVWATYNFKAVTNHHVNMMLTRAFLAITAQPGVSKLTQIGQAPYSWDPAIVSGATGYLLRQIALQLSIPQIAIFFSLDHRDEEDLISQRKEMIDTLNTKSKEYLEEFNVMLERIRIERYPRLGIITTPEFQLPGGRTRFFRAMFKGSRA